MGVKIFFCVFHPFLNTPQNSECFEYEHIGSNKKSSPCRMPKTKYPAPLAPPKPIVPYNHFGVCRGGVGSWPGAAPVISSSDSWKPSHCLHSFTQFCSLDHFNGERGRLCSPYLMFASVHSGIRTTTDRCLKGAKSPLQRCDVTYPLSF